MSLSIRRATKGDEELIHRYISELAEYEKLLQEVSATPTDIATALFCQQPRVFGEIAEWQGQPCGIALWFYNFSTFHGKHGLYLEDLYVAPEFRGRGIGKGLLCHLSQICERECLSRFQWWVLDWNAPAIEFYSSLGAVAMHEWTVFRLSGAPLKQLSHL